jgi:hypothetical protein
MAQSSYAKRQAEIKALRAAVEKARAECATESDALNLIVSVAKSIPGGVEALTECYRETVKADQVNLSSAIEKAMFHPKTLESNGDISQLVANAVFSDSAKKALNPDQDEELTKRRKKISDDIKESGIPRRAL